jgi:hypothetical protein
MNNKTERKEEKMEKTRRKIPSLAFIVTVLIGGFFTLFSIVESIGGFLTKPVDLSAGVGGLMQIVTFGLPFAVIAWLLWVKPKIGSLLLLIAGVSFGVWMYFGWRHPEKLHDWIVPSMLVFLPIILGALGTYTLVREYLPRRT